jgi:hypothetical protein
VVGRYGLCASREDSLSAHDRPVITPDQDRWAARPPRPRGNGGQPAAIHRLREANVALFANATAAELARVGCTASGEESVDRMRRLHAGHDLLHLRQLA